MLREMIQMMMGSTPMHMMQLTHSLSIQVYISFLFLILLLCVCVDCGYGVWRSVCGLWNLICHMCYLFPFLDDEWMTKFKMFECWIIFSYIYCVGSPWSFDYGMDNGVWTNV
ncbi:hypothetical protein AMTRI_Chr12g234950 [Amborella trichopoda]